MLELLENVEPDLIDVLSSLCVDEVEDEEDEDDSSLSEAEFASGLALLRTGTSVSVTGIVTEVEVGAPGRGPFVTSGTLLVTLSSDGVAIAPLMDLDNPSSASLEPEPAAVTVFDADSLTGLTTTAGSLSSSSNCRRFKNDLGSLRRCCSNSSSAAYRDPKRDDARYEASCCWRIAASDEREPEGPASTN